MGGTLWVQESVPREFQGMVVVAIVETCHVRHTMCMCKTHGVSHTSPTYGRQVGVLVVQDFRHTGTGTAWVARVPVPVWLLLSGPVV